MNWIRNILTILEAFSSVTVWKRWNSVNTRELAKIKITFEYGDYDEVEDNDEDGCGLHNCVRERVACEPIFAESVCFCSILKHKFNVCYFKSYLKELIVAEAIHHA
jgi:hypothetical protein